jgi:hypothetical protein
MSCLNECGSPKITVMAIDSGYDSYEVEQYLSFIRSWRVKSNHTYCLDVKRRYEMV